MPAVTVGVPVYNGDALLNECFECLAGQTLEDFEVLIYDNASTDRTASIAQAWVARDARFKYFRQSETVDAMQNFSDVLNAATAECFMWRAHDDTSAANFLEVTHRLLMSQPRAKLAVGRVQKLGEGRPQDSEVPNLDGGPRLLRIRRALRNYRPSWFYGLWKRQAAIEAFATVRRRNPHAWGLDHLIIFLLATDDAIVGSNETYFVKRKRKSNAPPSGRLPDELHTNFTEQCREMLEARPLNIAERVILRAMIGPYARRLFKPRKFEAWASATGAANGD